MKLIDDAYYEFYDGPVKGLIRSEHCEQVDAVTYTRHNFPDLLIFHPVNEGALPVQYRSKLLLAGMLPGISDIVIVRSCGGYHGALIEMKRATKGKSRVSDEQVEVMRWARNEGFFTAIAYGAEQYQKALHYYLEL